MVIRTLLAAGCFALLISCGGAGKQQATTTDKPSATTVTENIVRLSPEQIRQGDIRTGIPEKMDLHRKLKVHGFIDVPPDRMYSVSFPMGGYIEKINLLPGQPVRKGEVLVVLKDPQFIQLQQDYLSCVSKLTYLEADYNRQRELHATQAASEKVFQQAEADYRSQQVMAKALEEKLKLIGIDPLKLTTDKISSSVNVPAPINGFISKVNVNAGQYISPQDVMFELINPNDYHLNLSVLENDLGTLAIGQAVRCSPNNDPHKQYPAHILLINRNIGRDRSAEVHCHFAAYYPELTPGMYMNGEIELTKQQVMAVPNDAIVRWQNKNYLFAVKDSSAFEMLEVQTGISENGFTEITLQQFPEGIVVKNAYAILMKMKNNAEE